MTSREIIPPLEKEVVVSWDQQRAFERFTRDISAWWPLRTHSVGEASAESVVMEPRVGGRIVESIRGGKTSVWGTITHWDPPRRVAFTWHPGRPVSTAGHVEVVFTAHSSGTRLQLVHSGWESFGEKARGARKGYSIGWSGVLALYAGRTSAPIVRVNQVLMAIAGVMVRFRKTEALAP
jgi:uncharacterized protein YndB with AHSA1/START domain